MQPVNGQQVWPGAHVIFEDEDNSNLGLNAQSPSFWRCLQPCRGVFCFFFQTWSARLCICSFHGGGCTLSLFVLRSEGIHTLSYHLGFLMITVDFLRQTAVQLRVKVKSVWPFILSTSVCSFCQFIQVSECSAGLFVLASAAMCSYFLMFPVCVAAFPSLLSRIKPQDIQKANGGLESLLPATCIFFTFCQ